MAALDLGASIWSYMLVSTAPGVREPEPMPVLPVYLTGRQEWETFALVDTGATVSALPIENASALGVELRKGPGALAAAGMRMVDYYVADVPITIEVAGRVFTVEPHFADFPGMLLGRDVLAAFRITLDPRAGQFILDPYPAED